MTRARAELIADLADLDALREPWDELAVAAGQALSAPAWLLAWWRNVAPEDALLRTVAVHEGDRLIGLAPFWCARRGGLWEYRPLGSGMAIRNAPLAEAGRERAVARAIARTLAGAVPSPSVLHLDQLDANSRWPRTIAAEWPGLRPRLVRARAAPAPILHLADLTYDEWLAAKSSNFRQRLRRDARKLAKEGAAIRMARSPEELEMALDDFDRQHEDRWGDRSPLVSEGARRMMREAGDELLSSERFRAWTITIDNRPVTVQIFVVAGGEVVYCNGGWDAEWSSLSPGMQGIAAGLQDAFARGERRVDFGEEDHHYKKRLADDDAPLEWWRIYPRDARYPIVFARTLPARVRRAASAAALHLPDGVRRRIDRGGADAKGDTAQAGGSR